MAKKRKAGGRPAAQNATVPQRTKYNVEERFDDSEDEFQAGRDQILLEEAPDAKRRRKIAAQGSFVLGDVLGWFPRDFALTKIS